MDKSMKKAILLGFIFSVVLVAGCTGSGKGQYSETQGARITKFAFDTTSIYEDDNDVGLTLVYENVGAKKMDGTTYVYVYGPSLDDTDVTKGWDINSISDGTVAANVNFGTNLISWSKSSTEFYPPDPERGIPGVAKDVLILMKPMDSPEGINAQYAFNARVCYPYYTTTFTKLTSVGKEEYRSTGDATPGAAISVNSAGPIHIELKSGEKIRATSGATVTLPLVFVVTDVGGGFGTKPVADEPCNVNIAASKRGIAKINVTVDGVAATCGDGYARMRGSEAVVYCTAQFSSSVPKSEYQIVATATYNYYIDAQTDVTVKSVTAY